jgi:hypothetical protein
VPDPEIPREPVDARALPWTRLLEFLPALCAPESDPGEWTWPDVLSRFVDTLYSEGFIVAFDWPGWTQDQGRRLVEDPSALATAGLDDLYRVLTAHVRQDRFAEGISSPSTVQEPWRRSCGARMSITAPYTTTSRESTTVGIGSRTDVLGGPRMRSLGMSRTRPPRVSGGEISYIASWAAVIPRVTTLHDARRGYLQAAWRRSRAEPVRAVFELCRQQFVAT